MNKYLSFPNYHGTHIETYLCSHDQRRPHKRTTPRSKFERIACANTRPTTRRRRRLRSSTRERVRPTASDIFHVLRSRGAELCICYWWVCVCVWVFARRVLAALVLVISGLCIFHRRVPHRPMEAAACCNVGVCIDDINPIFPV